MRSGPQAARLFAPRAIICYIIFEPSYNLPDGNMQKNTDKTLKENFLKTLQESDSVTEALEASAFPKHLLCSALSKDKSFLKAFDKIINLKLEIALIEAALKSKTAGILCFSLTNRLPKKYNKSPKESPKKAETPGKIIYDGDE